MARTHNATMTKRNNGNRAVLGHPQEDANMHQPKRMAQFFVGAGEVQDEGMGLLLTHPANEAIASSYRSGRMQGSSGSPVPGNIPFSGVVPTPRATQRVHPTLPRPLPPLRDGRAFTTSLLRLLLGLCMLVMSALLFLGSSLPVAAHAWVGGNGRIVGQLVDGSKKNVPIAGQTMTLQLAQGDNAQDVATTKTDAQGKYSFGNLATDKTINYAVYTRYQGAQYTTDLIALDSKPTQQINLTAYEATSSSARIAVLDGTILVSEPDPVRATITISEVYFFKNLDVYSYVGSLNASKGKPNALLFSLPPQARNISLGMGFNGYNVIQVDRGFASDAAVPPGNSQFSFSYQVPYSGSSYDFSYTAQYATVQLSLLVPPSLQVTPKSLTSSGLITANQHPYRSFKAAQLLAQQGVQAQLSGLTAPSSASASSPLNNNLIWLLALLFAMVVVIFATALIARMRVPFGRRKERTLRGQQARRGGARGGREGDKEKPEKVERHDARGKREPKDRQEALLQELLELDKKYEAGKLTKAVYQERRAKTKARLRAIMSEEEARR